MSEQATQKPIPDLQALARTAGRAGMAYADWTDSEELYAALEAYDAAGARFDTLACEAAFREGRREHRLSGGWRRVWTTAPEAYDQFGTETVEACGPWRGRDLRCVIVDPAHADYQIARYGSGLCGSWDEDPRATEARIRAQVEAERLEREDRERRRAEGLVWLRTADVEALFADEDAGEQVLWGRGLTWTDLRAERTRRAEESAAAERAAKWARCRAAFVDGATLIDNGTPGFRGVYGWVRGRDPDAWRSCKVESHYAKPDDPDEAQVVGEGEIQVGTLEWVADRLAAGEFRVAAEGEHVPPRAVLKRIGCLHTELVRAEAGGQVAWVGRSGFGSDPLVLDEEGKVVRRKATREAALAAYREWLFAPSKNPTSI